VNGATINQIQTIEQLPQGTPPSRIDHLAFGWELVRALVTPLIHERMQNERFVCIFSLHSSVAESDPLGSETYTVPIRIRIWIRNDLASRIWIRNYLTSRIRIRISNYH